MARFLPRLLQHGGLWREVVRAARRGEGTDLESLALDCPCRQAYLDDFIKAWEQGKEARIKRAKKGQVAFLK